MVRLFNGDVPFISVLKRNITDSLSIYYSTQIDNKVKPLDAVFEYLKKLLGFNKTPTLNNINNFVTNPDMFNNSPSNIISYLNLLESKNLIVPKEKLDRLFNIINTIYKKFSQQPPVYPGSEYMDSKKYHSYLYFCDKFWSKWTAPMNGNHIKLDELAFRAKIASSLILTFNASSLVEFFGDTDELLILEKYYLELYLKICKSSENGIKVSSKSSNKIRMKVKSVKKGSTYTCGNLSDELYTSGNLSDELDTELGLN